MYNIMIIDDEKPILESIEKQLKEQNFNLYLESDPVEAIEKLKNNKIDIVLCDMRMKPISGLEVLNTLKIEYPKIPVIILTGYVDDNIYESVKKVGCAHFLLKPIRKKELIEAINRALDCINS